MKRADLLKRFGFTVPSENRIRMIVDTDAANEADDQFAIMHHLLTPTFDIRGIIAAHFERKPGNDGASMEKSYEEIKNCYFDPFRDSFADALPSAGRRGGGGQDADHTYPRLRPELYRRL